MRRLAAPVPPDRARTALGVRRDCPVVPGCWAYRRSVLVACPWPRPGLVMRARYHRTGVRRDIPRPGAVTPPPYAGVTLVPAGAARWPGPPGRPAAGRGGAPQRQHRQDV